MITDEALTERVDPALAVDRALNDRERRLLHDRTLVGPYRGAQPADWISEADNADAHLDVVEPWCERYSDLAVNSVRSEHPLPDRLLRRLVVSALYARIGIRHGIPDVPQVTDLAHRAALWARGYAEAAGWHPPEAPDGQ